MTKRVQSIMNIVLIIGFICIFQRTSEALTLTHFELYDFSSIAYDNRIRMSNTLTAVDFETNESFDSNQNGQIDTNETNTFLSRGEECDVYVGNLHNRYDISRFLVYMAVRGSYDSFYVEDTQVLPSDGVTIDDGSVYMPDYVDRSEFDSILLFEFEEVISDRDPNDSPLFENNPFHFTIHSPNTHDAHFALYLGAYGGLKSGTYNSYTPANSDIYFVAEQNDASKSASVPVPEPMVTFLGGILCLLVARFKS